MPIGNNADFAINAEPRCPVVLLLDNSGSMSGQPIQQLSRCAIASLYMTPFSMRSRDW